MTVAEDVALARKVADGLARSHPRVTPRQVVRILVERLEPAEQGQLLRALQNMDEAAISRGLRDALPKGQLASVRNIVDSMAVLAHQLGWRPSPPVLEGLLRLARDPLVDEALPALLADLAAHEHSVQVRDYLRAVGQIPGDAFSRRSVNKRMSALLERLFRHRGAAEFLRLHGWDDAFRPLLEWSQYDVEWIQRYGAKVVTDLADRRKMEIAEVAQALIDPSEKALQREAEALLRKAGATVSVGSEAVERVTRRGTLKSLVDAVDGWINVDRGNAWEGWLNRWVHTDPSMGVNPRLRVLQSFPSGEAERISDRVISLTAAPGGGYRAVVSDAKLLHEASVLPADQMIDWQFLIKKAAGGGFPSAHPVTGLPITVTGLEFVYIHHSQQRAMLSLAQATKLTSSVATQNMRFAYVVESGPGLVKTLAYVP